MTASVIGLVVLALTIGLVLAALELNHRRPRRPAAYRDDADTRRLLTDLTQARDRAWRGEITAPRPRTPRRPTNLFG